MAGVEIPLGKIEGLQETLDDLSRMAHTADDLTAVHAGAAVLVRNDQVRHFAEAKDSSGASWPPHAPLTIALRRGGEGPLLQDRGTLKASIQVKATSRLGWIVGTSLKYSRIHQLGGTVYPIKHEFLYIPVNKQGVRARGKASTLSYIRLRKAVIPKREYMYMTEPEKGQMVAYYSHAVTVRATTYIKWQLAGRWFTPKNFTMGEV